MYSGEEWDDQGETMLTLAAANGRAKVVNILCQIKADPKIENAKVWDGNFRSFTPSSRQWR